MPAQTTIQVRRGTASSWTSTNPTLAAGEVGFETDTGKFKIGTGSAVWTGLAYSSILPNTVTTKGDLLAATGSATVDRLAAAGSTSTTPLTITSATHGNILVQDQVPSTGFNYLPTFFAGKNKILNSDFSIWQRGTSFSGTNQLIYTADRWQLNDFGGQTSNVARSTFTAGTAPVSGYEGQYFATWSRGGAGTASSYLTQKIEDVRTFAGQTVTFSFWAKAAATETLDFYIDQNFGSGGSATVGSSSTSFTLTTSWTRYSFTVTLASISGKTIGTSSFLAPTFQVQTSQGAFTIDLWGVQLEAGSTATQFQTATGTIQGELAACQRYYYRALNDADNRSLNGLGWADSATTVVIQTTFPVPMRIRPTGVETTGTASNYLLAGAGLAANATAVTFDGVTTDQVGCTVFTISGGGTAGRVAQLRSSGANRYIAWSAEL